MRVEIKMNDPGRTRTCNPKDRSLVRYPLRHETDTQLTLRDSDDVNVSTRIDYICTFRNFTSRKSAKSLLFTILLGWMHACHAWLYDLLLSVYALCLALLVCPLSAWVFRVGVPLWPCALTLWILGALHSPPWFLRGEPCAAYALPLVGLWPTFLLSCKLACRSLHLHVVSPFDFDFWVNNEFLPPTPVKNKKSKIYIGTILDMHADMHPRWSPPLG